MFEKVKKILSEEEVKEISHLSSKYQKLKNDRDEIAKKIIAGEDNRLMLIVGPCSADNQDAVCDYVSRLAKVAEEVKDKIFIIPRIYTNKPRTRGEGYKGILHNPDPHKNVTDILAGIIAIRDMHIRAISESGLSAADEMLYPDNYHYLDDLLTYVAVGARSSENQQHRLVASGVDVPVGIKNPMNGSMSVTLNSIYAAQIPNEFKYLDYQVKTQGNAYAHAILRGSVDVYGNNHQNYHYEDIVKFSEMYAKQELKNPAIIIDTNHSNSGKNYIEQIRIAHEIVSNMHYSDSIKKIVKGMLIESYIEDGNQKITENVYGKSVTDSCLGWEKTQKLIYDIADRL
ncbi:MAG: 3-deoxy-7-phosphoheptulonate synthase [Clostridia bacterium]|nr:3-deoxy-7-phosphoheptulonate synthase [Clostridia bacterium]